MKAYHMTFDSRRNASETKTFQVYCNFTSKDLLPSLEYYTNYKIKRQEKKRQQNYYKCMDI